MRGVIKMDTKILRLAAGAVITDNTKMSKQAKHQMLEFIQHEASNTQLKGLLLDGKVPMHFDKDAANILNMRFENSALGKKLDIQEDALDYILASINLNEDALTTAVGVGMAATAIAPALVSGVIIAAVAKQAVIVANSYITKAGRRCRSYTGNARQKCQKIVKIESWKKQVGALKSGMSKCKKTKDPQQCKYALAGKIDKLEKKIKNAVIPG